jgi:hypothetical protein
MMAVILRSGATKDLLVAARAGAVATECHGIDGTPPKRSAQPKEQNDFSSRLSWNSVQRRAFRGKESATADPSLLTREMER